MVSDSTNRHPGRSEAESRDPEAIEMPGFPLSRESHHHCPEDAGGLEICQRGTPSQAGCALSLTISSVPIISMVLKSVSSCV